MTDQASRVAPTELRAFVERIERLDADKAAIMEDRKDVMAEAKGRGYDTKVIAKLIALRKKTPDQIAEEEALMDMYRQAIGL